MKATEQCFPLLLSNLQKNVIQSFESVDEIFKKCQSPFKIPYKANVELFINYAVLCITAFKVS